MGRRGIVALVVALAATATVVAARLAGTAKRGGRAEQALPAAVEVAPVEHGTIEQRRTFTGTLQARGRFVVAANVGGRVERLLVDLADPVRQGQVVAELDDAEQTEGVTEAAAELAVVRANLADAESALEISERQLQRAEALKDRGLAAESELDAAKARHLAQVTGLQVAKAQLNQAAASYRRATVRSAYTKVIALWSGEADPRVVAERHVAEGDTVAPNDPLFTIVDLDPLIAVVHVTERDYAQLSAEQQATLSTEAHPGKHFSGVIRRIAPVFHESSRQARMEIEIANPDGLLKPGMFVRADLLLRRAEGATIVPLTAVATRAGATGLFVVDPSGTRATWRPVELGIRAGERVQVLGTAFEGRVVTIGHQLIDDGAAITIPTPAGQPSAKAP